MFLFLKKYRIILKIPALFLSIYFSLFESLSYAQPFSGMGEARHTPREYPSRVSPNPPSRAIKLPESLGIVEEFHQGSSDKTMIYIQDAHDSLEAQENIARIINLLVGEYGVKTVFEEGYEGQVPSDGYFGFIQDLVLKEKISYFLMDQLRLSGAEYAHINRKGQEGRGKREEGRKGKNLPSSIFSLPSDFQLIGADSIQSHLANIQAYKKSSQNQEEVARELAAMEKEIQKLIDQNFPASVKEWIKLRTLFDEGKLGMVEYLQRMSRQSTDHGPRLPLRSGGQAQKGQTVSRGPSTVDRGQKYPTLSLLTAESTKDPAILEQIKSIRPQTLFREIRQMETDFISGELSKERDLKTFSYYQKLALLKRLNAKQLSSEEYESLALKTPPVAVENSSGRVQIPQIFSTEAFADFIIQEKHQWIVLSKKWEKNIQDSVRFYELAEERERFIEKTLMEEGRGKREEKAKLTSSESLPSSIFSLPSVPSVLVFGGFHKAGIKEILKRQGYSYYIVTPKISSVSKRHQDYYKRLMTLGSHEFETALGMAPKATRAADAYEVFSRLGIVNLTGVAEPFKGFDHKRFNLELLNARSEVRSNMLDVIREAHELFDRYMESPEVKALRSISEPKIIGPYKEALDQAWRVGYGSGFSFQELYGLEQKVSNALSSLAGDSTLKDGGNTDEIFYTRVWQPLAALRERYEKLVVTLTLISQKKRIAPNRYFYDLFSLSQANEIVSKKIFSICASAKWQKRVPLKNLQDQLFFGIVFEHFFEAFPWETEQRDKAWEVLSEIDTHLDALTSIYGPSHKLDAVTLRTGVQVLKTKLEEVLDETGHLSDSAKARMFLRYLDQIKTTALQSASLELLTQTQIPESQKAWLGILAAVHSFAHDIQPEKWPDTWDFNLTEIEKRLNEYIQDLREAYQESGIDGRRSEVRSKEDKAGNESEAPASSLRGNEGWSQKNPWNYLTDLKASRDDLLKQLKETPRRKSVAISKTAEPDLILTYHGRIAPLKNLSVFIRTAGRVAEHMAQIGKPFRVELIGGDPRHKPYYHYLKRLAQREGIDRITDFRGDYETTQIPKLYQNFPKAQRVYLFTGEDETFGFAPLEAMNLGIPMVTSDQAAMREVVGSRSKDQDAGGILVPVSGLTQQEKADRYAEAVIRLAKDPQRLKQASKEAKKAARRFSSKGMVLAYQKLFQDQLKGSLSQECLVEYVSPGLFPYELGGVAQWARHLFGGLMGTEALKGKHPLHYRLRSLFPTSFSHASITDENRKVVERFKEKEIITVKNGIRDSKGIPNDQAIRGTIQPVLNHFVSQISEVASKGDFYERMKHSSVPADLDNLLRMNDILRRYNWQTIAGLFRISIQQAIPGHDILDEEWKLFENNYLVPFFRFLALPLSVGPDLWILDGSHVFGLHAVLSKRFAEKGLEPKKAKLIFVQHSRGSEHQFLRVQKSQISSRTIKLLHEKMFIYFHKLYYDYADKVVAVSQTPREYLLRLGVPEDKIVVIPNGLDLNKPKNAKRSEMRSHNMKVSPGDSHLLLSIRVPVPPGNGTEPHIQDLREAYQESGIDGRRSEVRSKEDKAGNEPAAPKDAFLLDGARAIEILETVYEGALRVASYIEQENQKRPLLIVFSGGSALLAYAFFDTAWKQLFKGTRPPVSLWLKPGTNEELYKAKLRAMKVGKKDRTPERILEILNIIESEAKNFREKLLAQILDDFEDPGGAALGVLKRFNAFFIDDFAQEGWKCLCLKRVFPVLGIPGMNFAFFVASEKMRRIIGERDAIGIFNESILRGMNQLTSAASFWTDWGDADEVLGQVESFIHMASEIAARIKIPKDLRPDNHRSEVRGNKSTRSEVRAFFTLGVVTGAGIGAAAGILLGWYFQSRYAKEPRAFQGETPPHFSRGQIKVYVQLIVLGAVTGGFFGGLLHHLLASRSLSKMKEVTSFIERKFGRLPGFSEESMVPLYLVNQGFDQEAMSRAIASLENAGERVFVGDLMLLSDTLKKPGLKGLLADRKILETEIGAVYGKQSVIAKKGLSHAEPLLRPAVKDLSTLALFRAVLLLRNLENNRDFQTSLGRLLSENLQVTNTEFGGKIVYDAGVLKFAPVQSGSKKDNAYRPIMNLAFYDGWMVYHFHVARGIDSAWGASPSKGFPFMGGDMLAVGEDNTYGVLITPVGYPIDSDGQPRKSFLNVNVDFYYVDKRPGRQVDELFNGQPMVLDLGIFKIPYKEKEKVRGTKAGTDIRAEVRTENNPVPLRRRTDSIRVPVPEVSGSTLQPGTRGTGTDSVHFKIQKLFTAAKPLAGLNLEPFNFELLNTRSEMRGVFHPEEKVTVTDEGDRDIRSELRNLLTSGVLIGAGIGVAVGVLLAWYFQRQYAKEYAALYKSNPPHFSRGQIKVYVQLIVLGAVTGGFFGGMLELMIKSWRVPKPVVEIQKPHLRSEVRSWPLVKLLRNVSAKLSSAAEHLPEPIFASWRLNSHYELEARLEAQYENFRTIKISILHHPKKKSATEVWSQMEVVANEMPVNHEYLKYLLHAIDQRIGIVERKDYLDSVGASMEKPSANVDRLFKAHVKDVVIDAHQSLDEWRLLEDWLRNHPNHPLLHGYQVKLISSTAVGRYDTSGMIVIDRKVEIDRKRKIISIFGNPMLIGGIGLCVDIANQVRQEAGIKRTDITENPLYQTLARAATRELSFKRAYKAPMDGLNHWAFSNGFGSHDRTFHASPVQNYIVVDRMSGTLARMNTASLNPEDDLKEGNVQFVFYIKISATQGAEEILGEYLRFIEMKIRGEDPLGKEPQNELFRQFAAAFAERKAVQVLEAGVSAPTLLPVRSETRQELFDPDVPLSPEIRDSILSLLPKSIVGDQADQFSIEREKVSFDIPPETYVYLKVKFPDGNLALQLIQHKTTLTLHSGFKGRRPAEYDEAAQTAYQQKGFSKGGTFFAWWYENYLRPFALQNKFEFLEMVLAQNEDKLSVEDMNRLGFKARTEKNVRLVQMMADLRSELRSLLTVGFLIGAGIGAAAGVPVAWKFQRDYFNHYRVFHKKMPDIFASNRSEIRGNLSEIHKQRLERLKSQTWFGLLTDIDYTLSDGEGRISPACIQRIANFLTRGIRVGLLTGRIYDSADATSVNLRTSKKIEYQAADIKHQIIPLIQSSLGPDHQDKFASLEIFSEGSSHAFNLSRPRKFYVMGKSEPFDAKKRGLIIREFRSLFSQERLDAYQVTAPSPLGPNVNFKTRAVSVSRLELPRPNNDFVPDMIRKIKGIFSKIGREVDVVWGGEGFDIYPKGFDKEAGVEKFGQILGSDSFISVDDAGGELGGGKPLTNRWGGVSTDQFDLNNPNVVSTEYAVGKKYSHGWIALIDALTFERDSSGDNELLGNPRSEVRTSNEKEICLLVLNTPSKKKGPGRPMKYTRESVKAEMKRLIEKFAELHPGVQVTAGQLARVSGGLYNDQNIRDLLDKPYGLWKELGIEKGKPGRPRKHFRSEVRTKQIKMIEGDKEYSVTVPEGFKRESFDFSWRERAKFVKSFQQSSDNGSPQKVDLVVVGAGAAGVNIADLAVKQGKSVLLLDQGSIAGETSSVTSGYLHGYIRYLGLGLDALKKGEFEKAKSNFRQVYKAMRQQKRWKYLAPDLVEQVPVFIPIHRNGERKLWEMWFLVFIHNLMAFNFKLPEFISSTDETFKERFPHLNPEGLQGVLVIYESITRDAVLTNRTARESYYYGADIITHAEAAGEYPKEGDYHKVTVTDKLTGKIFTVLAREVKEAKGPWLDPKILKPSRGTHLWIRNAELAKKINGYFLIMGKEDRFYFIESRKINGEEIVIVGPTSRDLKESVGNNPKGKNSAPNEIRELFGVLRNEFPDLEINLEDVFAYAGIRPLDAGRADGGGSDQAPREHRWVTGPDGVRQIVGAKLTSARSAAAEEMGELSDETPFVVLPGDESLDFKPADDRQDWISHLVRFNSLMTLSELMFQHRGEVIFKTDADVEAASRIMAQPDLLHWDERTRLAQIAVYQALRKNYTDPVEVWRTQVRLKMESGSASQVSPNLFVLEEDEQGSFVRWKLNPVDQKVYLMDSYKNLLPSVNVAAALNSLGIGVTFRAGVKSSAVIYPIAGGSESLSYADPEWFIKTLDQIFNASRSEVRIPVKIQGIDPGTTFELEIPADEEGQRDSKLLEAWKLDDGISFTRSCASGDRSKPHYLEWIWILNHLDEVNSEFNDEEIDRLQRIFIVYLADFPPVRDFSLKLQIAHLLVAEARVRSKLSKNDLASSQRKRDESWQRTIQAMLKLSAANLEYYYDKQQINLPPLNFLEDTLLSLQRLRQPILNEVIKELTDGWSHWVETGHALYRHAITARPIFEDELYEPTLESYDPLNSDTIVKSQREIQRAEELILELQEAMTPETPHAKAAWDRPIEYLTGVSKKHSTVVFHTHPNWRDLRQTNLDLPNALKVQAAFLQSLQEQGFDHWAFLYPQPYVEPIHDWLRKNGKDVTYQDLYKALENFLNVNSDTTESGNLRDVLGMHFSGEPLRVNWAVQFWQKVDRARRMGKEKVKINLFKEIESNFKEELRVWLEKTQGRKQILIDARQAESQNEFARPTFEDYPQDSAVFIHWLTKSTHMMSGRFAFKEGVRNAAHRVGKKGWGDHASAAISMDDPPDKGNPFLSVIEKNEIDFPLASIHFNFRNTPRVKALLLTSNSDEDRVAEFEVPGSRERVTQPRSLMPSGATRSNARSIEPQPDNSSEGNSVSVPKVAGSGKDANANPAPAEQVPNHSITLKRSEIRHNPDVSDADTGAQVFREKVEQLGHSILDNDRQVFETLMSEFRKIISLGAPHAEPFWQGLETMLPAGARDESALISAALRLATGDTKLQIEAHILNLAALLSQEHQGLREKRKQFYKNVMKAQEIFGKEINSEDQPLWDHLDDARALILKLEHFLQWENPLVETAWVQKAVERLLWEVGIQAA
ncbi:MAG: FAD-dependent oxidoreductase, partial [Candidatus Omnitrophica bacterium]|nr:FAD-dependent oxidoreductase [Candidatus Omnitrophota bacterium]